MPTKAKRAAEEPSEPSKPAKRARISKDTLAPLTKKKGKKTKKFEWRYNPTHEQELDDHATFFQMLLDGEPGHDGTSWEEHLRSEYCQIPQQQIDWLKNRFEDYIIRYNLLVENKPKRGEEKTEQRTNDEHELLRYMAFLKVCNMWAEDGCPDVLEWQIKMYDYRDSSIGVLDREQERELGIGGGPAYEYEYQGDEFFVEKMRECGHVYEVGETRYSGHHNG